MLQLYYDTAVLKGSDWCAFDGIATPAASTYAIVQYASTTVSAVGEGTERYEYAVRETGNERTAGVVGCSSQPHTPG